MAPVSPRCAFHTAGEADFMFCGRFLKVSFPAERKKKLIMEWNTKQVIDGFALHNIVE